MASVAIDGKRRAVVKVKWASFAELESLALAVAQRRLMGWKIAETVGPTESSFL